MNRVAIVAAGMSKFGIRRKASYRDLISEAGKAILDNNKKIDKKDIDGFVLATVYPERSAYQGHPAPLAIECLGLSPFNMFERVESQCASGAVGIRAAYAAILSGLAEVVMVLGVEKLFPPGGHREIFLNAMAGSDREWEGSFGITPAPAFAMAAQAHMEKYGTTEEQLAMISVKNHQHSTKNPYAAFQDPVSLDQVMSSRLIASPLKLYDCCPNADGAAAVIVTSEERAKAYTDKPVYVRGFGEAMMAYNLANYHKDWAEWPGAKVGAEKAYKMAGVTPEDIDFAEVHDCFTISELVVVEECGFCKKGEGGKFVEEGQSDYGGKIVINPSGGLIGCGHPFGATALRQAHECFLQLRGEAGERQVEGAKIAFAQTGSSIMHNETNIVIYEGGG